MNNLEEIRKEINQIDSEMAHLFELRMDASKKVAFYKRQAGMQIEDKSREDAIVEQNSKHIDNKDYLPYYLNFIENNMKLSKAYQRKLISGMQIAVSGTKGAFADICASKVFNGAFNIPFSDFSSAYKSAQNGESDVAFLPIENSFGGDVGAVLDLAFFGNLFINGIYETEIIQNLVGLKYSSLSDIKTVASHPQALVQCSKFITDNNLSTIETTNTTKAVQLVLEKNDKTIAAIASEEAANSNSLKVIKNQINESNQNTTRFAVFSRVKPTKNNKDNRFILMFTVKNTAGALSKAIMVIGEYGFNLIDLKSRPTKLQNWNHYFYIEGEGNIFSENGEKMTEELKKCCDNFKIVGSFNKEVKV